jgi:hypothetical protein
MWSINGHNFWARTLAFRRIDRTRRALRRKLTTWDVVASYCTLCDSATASLVDPHSDLLVLAMSETESTLRSFVPVYG